MAFRIHKLNTKGYTLIELSIATAIMAVMATTVITANQFVNKQSVANQDRTFATEKAIQMYEELRALVSGNEQMGINVLQNYSNYSNYDTVLTTDKNVDTGLPTANPADPLSGNILTDGNWRYMRQVEINPVANDTQARQVTVKVFLYPGNFISQASPITVTGPLLATVGGVLRTSALPNVPSQVMDMYILQINNIPSWWSVLPTLAGSMQAAVDDLESRLQGVQLRVHYITRTSYGRDPLYVPETNSFNNPTESTHQQWVYFYPGITPQDSPLPDFWYYDPQTTGDPNSLLMTGNFMVDGTSYPVTQSQFQGASNGVSTGGYSVADQYNNAMRYPDEIAAYSAVTQAAATIVAAGGIVQEGTTEISERMLLEGMLSQPASFANSIIVNLHGELLPLPPLRNYSDAAKDPGNQLALTSSPMTCNIPASGYTAPTTGNTNVRVVTHPELLYYPGAATNSQYVTVRYRVYAYYDGEDTGGVLPQGDPRVPAISLFFPDAAATVVGVTAVIGNASIPLNYAYASPPGTYSSMPYNGTVPGDVAANPMSVWIANNHVGNGNQTLITLYNTPLRCGEEITPPTPNPNVAVNPAPNANANANPNLEVPCTISFDHAVTTDTASVTQTSFNYTVNTGTNPLLVVQINCAANVADPVKTCSYNGVSLNKAVAEQTSTSRSDLETWYMANPPTNHSYPISVVMTSTTKFDLAVAASSYFNVNDSTATSPLGASISIGNQASSNGHAITITTTQNNSWLINQIEYRGSTTFTLGGTQTQIWNQLNGSTYQDEGNYETTGNAGSYSATYSCSGTAHSADMTSVEFIAATCAITPSNTPTYTNTATNTVPTNTFTVTNTYTYTYTHTNTPVPPTATPTPTFTNGPCAIAFSSATTYTSGGKVTSASIPCTVTGVNNLLLAQIDVQDNGGSTTVKSCYYMQTPMAQAVGLSDTNSNHGDLETWYIAESGSITTNMAVTLSASATLVVGALSYQGVDQTNPIGNTATVSNQGAGGSPVHFIPITTSANNSWIVGLVEFNNTGGITPAGTQNQRWYEETAIDAEGDDMLAGAVGSHQLNYTTGSHSADLEAVEIRPCYIGPTPTPTATNTPIPVINTSTFTNTPTPVFTNTPTITGPLTPSGGGLASGARLYGAEYVPCPPDAQSGTFLSVSTYNNNTYTYTGKDLTNTTNGATIPKNTARWIISVVMPVTCTFPNAVTIMGAVYPNGVTFAGQHALETRLGNAVTTSVVTIGAAPVTIYPNLSRTYVWCGDAFMPPHTEQYQFLGDPRDCPYYDVKFGGVSMTGASVTIGPNAYNWWFKNGNTGEMVADGYGGFGASGNNNYWPGGNNGGGNVQVDLPRYYQLIRQGLLNSTSIWTGTNGWSWFYYGLGGEVGSDQNPRSGGVVMYDDLFRTSTGGAVTAGVNAVYQGDGQDGSHGKGLWVVSNVKGSNSVTWYQRSWLGELYPDKCYNTWVTYGNLPSVATNIGTAGAPETFYLEPMENVQTAGPSGNSTDGFNTTTFWPNPGGVGSESFYDGNNSTTGKTFEHQANDANGTELSLAVTTYNIYPFPLPDIVDVNRKWDLNGANPPEWALAPYNSAALRTSIDIPTFTSSAGTLSRLFYDYNQNGSLPTTSPYGSGVIRMTQINTIPSTPITQIGYVIETGSAPSGDVGVQTLAETALVLGMRTFLDGGQMAVTGAPGHVVQIPLVKIFLAQAIPEYSASQGISFTVASPVTATSNGGGAVSVGMPVTDIWWGYNPNGLASYYTEEYPNYGQPMTTEAGMYQEAVSVIYNLKYSGNGGKNWYFVQDSAAAVTGVCDNSASHAITNTAPWGYNWPVATGYIGGAALPQGVYELMVEAYRQNYGEHYAYDIQNLEVSW